MKEKKKTKTGKNSDFATEPAAQAQFNFVNVKRKLNNKNSLSGVSGSRMINLAGDLRLKNKNLNKNTDKNRKYYHQQIKNLNLSLDKIQNICPNYMNDERTSTSLNSSLSVHQNSQPLVFTPKEISTLLKQVKSNLLIYFIFSKILPKITSTLKWLEIKSLQG